MAILRITVPDPAVDEALEAIEQVWRRDAERVFGKAAYEALPPAQKLQQCLAAELRVRTRNSLREKAERAVVMPPEPDVA